MAKLLFYPLVGLLLIVLTDAGIADERDTIPPEILKQFDLDIRSGKRPTFAVIRQEDIFGLRENPKFKEDFVTLSFNMRILSSVQMKIIANWVKAGHNKIYIKEQSFYSYAKLFGYQTKLSGRGGFKLLPSSVSTDCYNLELAGFGLSAISQFPGKSTIIAEVREGALCGVFFLGETKIYFKSRTLGPDADRFDLNWWQWAMGLQVPGAASTAVGGFSDLTLGQAAKYDLITLKNGDTVSGTVTVESVKIETSYGTLTFTIQELEKLTFEGSGNNVDIVSLRIGDKLSGSVQNNAIKVKLVGGNEIEIAKDKIRDIQLRKQDR